jgi:hypothetical protein
MCEEHVLRVDLDEMFPADGLYVEENVIFDAYWAIDRDGLSIITHVYRHFDEERGDIIPEKTHWYFGDGISIPETAEVGLAVFGLKSVEEVEVQITLENKERFRLPYRAVEL